MCIKWSSFSEAVALKKLVVNRAQELGMVIGVGFLVGILFLLMIYVEKAWASTTDRLHDLCGRKPKDEEDPAALVGTFKRYKN